MNKRLKSPLNVQVEITGDCTSECVHCYNFWRAKCGKPTSCPHSGKLSEHDAVQIVQKLATADVMSVSITGGEPIMNFDVALTCIKTARSLGMGVGFNSNLVLLSTDKARELKQAGLDHILTSILGPNPDVHDSITQRKGSFKGLLDGIKNARDAGIRVSANMVVTKLNHEHVIETANVVAGLGIKSFMATKAGCPGNCPDFSHLRLSAQQVIRMLNDLCWAHDHLSLSVDTLEPIPSCAMSGVLYPELFTSRKCNAGVTTATISYDGTVRPCPHLNISYGNLLTEELDKIWERMAPWSERFQIPSQCSSCKLINLCGAGCRMEGKMHTGDIAGTDPFISLQCVPQMIENMSRASARIPPRTVLAFRTLGFRLRTEEFGGVLACGKRHIFLDQKGFAVLQQLKPKTRYELESADINWNGLDPERFITGLANRHAVLVEE